MVMIIDHCYEQDMTMLRSTLNDMAALMKFATVALTLDPGSFIAVCISADP